MCKTSGILQVLRTTTTKKPSPPPPKLKWFYKPPADTCHQAAIHTQNNHLSVHCSCSAGYSPQRDKYPSQVCQVAAQTAIPAHTRNRMWQKQNKPPPPLHKQHSLLWTKKKGRKNNPPPKTHNPPPPPPTYHHNPPTNQPTSKAKKWTTHEVVEPEHNWNFWLAFKKWESHTNRVKNNSGC